ncbi:serine protease [Corallococcus sp. AB049A]|uniref:effector-associated domain EAD1-containing protein n=1 Tax=Corallococcus sp. AB049A TaxID=2316721 RepID=UPI000EDCF89C|nr:effector-associated domain EAD1-containing protein [Corallococcus sp. AB049A]RKI72900.1 serine protease [Corallococcus sp. AB049A]
MELSGAELYRLQQALLSAFPDVDKLAQMLRFRCNENLDLYTSGALKKRVFELLLEAEANGWTAKLIEGAHAANSSNPKLARFYLDYQSSVQRSIPGKILERLVSQARGFVDPALFRNRLEELEGRVCRIERRPGEEVGTGFLVSPNVVLTNHHVIERAATSFQARFDHKLIPHQNDALDPGKVYGVTECIAKSPHSSVDLSFPRKGLPTLQELDYALLRLDGAPGDELVGTRKRGWLELPAQPYDFQAGSAIVILQHPLGGPLKLAHDGFLDINDNRTRVTYKTNTEPGSSGSPCFDEALTTLVALHHSGDPRMKQQADFNEGIPTATIRESLSPAVKALLGWN